MEIKGECTWTCKGRLDHLGYMIETFPIRNFNLKKRRRRPRQPRVAFTRRKVHAGRGTCTLCDKEMVITSIYYHIKKALIHAEDRENMTIDPEIGAMAYMNKF